VGVNGVVGANCGTGRKDVIVSGDGFTDFVLCVGRVCWGFGQYLAWGEPRREMEGVEACPEERSSS
jgi:hypothetical protein